MSRSAQITQRSEDLRERKKCIKMSKDMGNPEKEYRETSEILDDIYSPEYTEIPGIIDSPKNKEIQQTKIIPKTKRFHRLWLQKTRSVD